MHLIAECGVNWNTIEEAKKMIHQSKLAHASYSKFQLFNEDVIKGSPLYEELKKRILTKEDAKELFDYGEQIKQPVFFTPMYLNAVDICEEIGVELYKIRLADRYNIPLVRKVLDTNKKLLMSINYEYTMPRPVLTHTHRIEFLLCVPEYPASAESYKLDKTSFQFFSGISDHTPDLELARRALKLNPNIIIEKHVKMNNNCIENDWSVTFDELKSLYAFEEKK